MKISEEKEGSMCRLEGTVQYAKTLQERLTKEEIAGLERDMILLLAQIKVRG